MILDLNLNQVSFEIDGKNREIAFENVKRGDSTSYRLAVTLQYPADKVELMSYEEDHSPVIEVVNE